jgi:outer membrane protein insertion porin family
MSKWIRRFCISLVLAMSAAAYSAAAQTPAIVNRVEVQGYRRVRGETVRALIFTRPGDPYCEECLRADLQALRRNPNFEDASLEVEDDPTRPNTKIVIFSVVERFIIRRITYRGLKSVSETDLLVHLKDRKVNLSVESVFNPADASKAELVIREMLAEHGHYVATVKSNAENLPGTNAVSIVFTIDEGPSGSK